MNRYLRHYIRNRKIVINNSRHNIRIYEIEYLDENDLSVHSLIFNNEPKHIKDIYQKLPNKFINYLNDYRTNIISNNDNKVAQVYYLVLNDDNLFKQLNHDAFVNLFMSENGQRSTLTMMLKKITETPHLMGIYNSRFFSTIMGVIQQDIDDNRYNDDFQINRDVKNFFKKYISLHESDIMEGPEILRLRTEYFKKYLTQ
jgi:hypothetical protein